MRRLLTCALIASGAAAATLAASARAAIPEPGDTEGWARSAGVWLTPEATLEGTGAAAPPRGAGSLDFLRPRYPRSRWALSLTASAGPGAALTITDGGDRTLARLVGRPGGGLAVRTRSGLRTLPPNAAASGHRVEITAGADGLLAVDGRRVARLPSGARPVLAAGGALPVGLSTVLVTPRSAPEALVLHRVADLHARTPAGRFPLGEGDDGQLRFSPGWTSGFWPGVLWEASRLLPRAPFGRWALEASVARVGGERQQTHDLGFMFGRSVVLAHQRRCAGRAIAAQCDALRASGIAAADTLVALAATNAGGTLPTDARGPEAVTIIDSAMNLGLLTWASETTGDPTYRDLAARHARLLIDLLQRPDGSTIQVLRHDRTTGAVLGRDTRQGISASTTWSRGQAWAIYGLADTGRALRDAGIVRAAELAAEYWVRRHRPGTLPPYDFDAPPNAPRDSSAALIAAAGMYELDRACRAVPAGCSTPSRWPGDASRVLDDGLQAVSSSPPLGRVGEQAYRVGPRGGSWDDRAELIWGLDFALEAVAARVRAQGRR